MSFSEAKVWLVTGASSGIGRAVVAHVLGKGERVVATLRKPQDLDYLAAKYSKEQLLIVKLDVVSHDEIKAAFAKAAETFGRIDVVYNNAGFAALAEVEGTPDGVARGLFEVNFWGANNVSTEAVRVFRDVNKPAGGRLIIASSMVGIQPQPGVGFYSASKHALEGVSQAMAAELHPSWNIGVTIIELGGYNTRAASPEGVVTIPPHPAYTGDSILTSIRNYVAPGGAFRPPGDADKAAREIRNIAYATDVGLRVQLGLDSREAVNQQLALYQKDLDASEKWSTDLKLEA